MMKLINPQTAEGKILAGNLLFAACCIVYLAWWRVTFQPGVTVQVMIRIVLILITAALGFYALAMIVSGCRQVSAGNQYSIIMAIGTGVYLVLVMITFVFLNRPVTMELALIVFWICMELCALTALYNSRVFCAKTFVVISAIAIAATIVSLISYMNYYKLKPMDAFYDGMIPLIIFALVMIGISVMQVLQMHRTRRKV